MITMKDLDLIRVLAGTGSLTAAAKQLHISQSAASQRLSGLTARLELELFERRDGMMRPTVAGERLRQAASAIAVELDSALADIRLLDPGNATQLRIATQCYTCYRWLPFVIRSLREEYPQLSVDVVPEATDNIYAALASRQLDVGIVSNPDDETRWKQHELFSDELLAVVHRSHPLAREKILLPQQFQQQTLVLYTGTRHAIVEEILKPAGVTDFNIVQVRITEAIIELVRAGQGIAVIAGWALDDIRETKGLQALQITKQGFCRTWRAVVGDVAHPAHAESFVRHTQSIGGALGDRAWRQQLRAIFPS